MPLALLLSRTLRFDAADPLWPDRDRLLVSKIAAPVTRAASENLQGASPDGLFDTSAEPVGLGVGAALAERLLAARFGRSLVDHRSWVLADSSRLATGLVQEAACLAGLWRLGRLAVIACGPDEDAAPLGAAGFAAFGWTVRRVAAGDLAGLAGAVSAALRSFKPSLILWADDATRVPDTADPDEAESWRVCARGGAGARRSWLKRLARHAGRAELEASLAGRLPSGWHSRLAEPAWLPEAGQAISTAHAVRLAMADIAPDLPMLTMLPGDPAWPASHSLAEPGLRRGGALRLGASAALAGLALHGGTFPVLAASDFDAAPVDTARSLHILIETAEITGVSLATMRANPGLLVLRPADATEAIECLELALRHMGPSVVLVSERAAPVLAERPTRTRATRGGYLAAGAPGPRAATLLAGGPDLHVALAARTVLHAAGLAVSVVSLPCWSLFAAQEPGWRAQVLGTAPLIGLEASTGFGWERWLGDGLFVSLLDADASTERRAATVARAVERHVRGLAAAP